MDKEKLIKNGKFYNPETATVIAKSSWFTHYKTQRRVIYQSAKGTFFEVKEIALVKFHPTSVSSMNLVHVQFTDGTEGGIGTVTASEHSINPKDEGFRDDVIIAEVLIIDELTEEQLRKKYEYIVQGGRYAMSHHAYATYRFNKSYSELFKIEEV